MQNEICRILTGGAKYDTTPRFMDTDYLVILDSDLEFGRFFDKVNQIDYLCYGKDFLHKLLNRETTHFNLPYVLLEMANQDVYETKYDLFGNIDYVKQVYVEWLTKNKNAMIKNISASKRIFYAFVLMYFTKNKAYYLTDTQQKIVNNVHQMIDIPDSAISELVKFFGLDKWFEKELQSLVKVWKRKPKKVKTDEKVLQEKLNLVRRKRENDCFPIINRGQLWYDTLSEQQKTELRNWYQQWLDVTTTFVIPTKPEWLK